MVHAIIFNRDFCGKRAEGQKNSLIKHLEFFIMHPPKVIRGREEKRRNVLSKARTCNLSLCLHTSTPPT